MYRALLAVCNRDGGASSMEGRYRRSGLSKDSTKLPSRSWVLGILKESRHGHMLIRCKRMVKWSMLRARRRGMLRKAVDVSADMHDIPFYGKVTDAFYVVRSKGKKGRHKAQPAGHASLSGEWIASHAGRWGSSGGGRAAPACCGGGCWRPAAGTA